MFLRKHPGRAILRAGTRVGLLAALALSLSPALAQGRIERTDEPTGDESETVIERTETPSGRPPAREPARASATPGKSEGSDRAPWAWPWAGAARSPAWTQDWTWANTHFWVIDVGHVELNLRYDGVVSRRPHNDVDNYGKAQARIGLLPHLELMVSEQITLIHDDHLRQQGNEIGARLSIWDYGTLPLNPVVEAIWKPRHGDGPDEWEGRVHLGGELLPGLYVAGNGFFQGQTGGSHDYFWGVRWGVSYELVNNVLRVGGEGGVSWLFNPDNDSPFRYTAPTAGPTVLFRPLGLLSEKWGHLLKVTASCEFGLRDDNANLPFLRGSLVLGCQF